MFEMVHKVRVGRYRLELIEGVTIRRSVAGLAATAEVSLPATAFNRALEVEYKLNRGDRVDIRLGYDIPTLEFEGWLQAININQGTITLLCEDEVFRLRRAVQNKEYRDVGLAQLLRQLLGQMPDQYGLDCSYDFKYDKYVVNNATMFDVLRNIQEETRAYIYVEGMTLHVHPAESIAGPTQYYDFQRNIETDNLKYMRAEDRRFEVEVQAFNAQGKRIVVRRGITGGDREVVKVHGVVDRASLERLAELALSRHSYTGYQGSITGWLEPYCAPTWSVVLIDRQYPYREGRYFVKSTTVTFNRNGGKREVELGIKLKDG